MRPVTRVGILAAALLGLLPLLARAAVITPELAQQLATHTAGEDIPVIIQFAERVDLRQFLLKDRRLRNAVLLRALRNKADRFQRLFKPDLDRYPARDYKQLWLINGISVTLPAGAIEQLARNPIVGRIQFDAPVPLAAATPAAASSAGWNLAAIHAPDVWALGSDGAGVVVANMDTGVDPNHPDLAGRWRGGSNSWFDPYGQHATPYDFSGHGTQTMGILVGGAASGTAIGVAPGARWIAVKIYDDAGQGTLSKIHQAFQWLIDPDGIPATLDAPDVVNASWGLLSGAAGSCNLEFSEDIRALKAAGTAVVFAAGNDGPAPDSSVSPANNPESFSAGAVDSTLALFAQSSRGPSGCDGLIFPKVVAPGVNVVTSDLSAGGLAVYATVSGTSFATPHVAGSLALLAGAFPSATIAELEGALTDSAQDLGAPGAENDYGYGLNDALAAYHLLAAAGGAQHAPNITSTPVKNVTEGQPYRYQVTASDVDGDSLVYALDTAPSGMTIDAASGLASWTPSHAQVGANAVAVRVTDTTGRFGTQSFLVAVARINNAPVAANDSYSVGAGSTLAVAAPGVLANDRDPDGDAMTAVLASGPSRGTLTLNADGSFRYVPGAGYAGADSFSYRDSDGMTSGNAAVVSLTVTAAANKAPVAGNDAFTAPVRAKLLGYAAQVFNILANDSDPDGSINAATVSIASAPNQGGSVTVNGNGTVSYVPKFKFTGTETFTYKVKDNSGAVSNAATVTVTVR
jgi:subtilisin family serine protease